MMPDAETAPEQQGEPLKSVTIEQQADGTYLVGTEAPGPDTEGMGEMQQDAAGGMQPAATIAFCFGNGQANTWRRRRISKPWCNCKTSMEQLND